MRCKINVFNISKINSEVRGGRSPRIKRLSEYIGESYFEYLAALPDLVLLMDESHRYRASAGVRAINELRPVLGLELTATPYVESPRGPVQFRNVIFDYRLAQAMADGFVKEPAVITRKDFNPTGMSLPEIERMKLEDGIRLHESIKVELETYARETGNQLVKPFLLVIARDTRHASELLGLIESDHFFNRAYAGRAIQVDSSKTGAAEDEMIERLLRVEDPTEPTEIVVHVNMLKEGWDVTNLYTIVPLRAANARTLIEQSIGRGLRLPYGKRTGVASLDRLNIVAHDRFQEIVDEANRPGSVIRLQVVELDPTQLQQKIVSVIPRSQLDAELGLADGRGSSGYTYPTSHEPHFLTIAETKVAATAYQVVRHLESQPDQLPGLSFLGETAVQQKIVEQVTEALQTGQLALPGAEPDVPAIVAKATAIIAARSIDIPRILVVPTGEVRAGFHPFALDLSSVRYQPPSEDLWLQYLRTGASHVVGLASRESQEVRPTDYIVRALIDFDDVAYDEHADLLYDLAAQVVKHLQTYLGADDINKVLAVYSRPVAQLIHAQMQDHYWEDAVDYEVKVSKGFTELRKPAYTAQATAPLDFRSSPADKSNMGKYLFAGFERCLFDLVKFESDPERRLAVILDRESLKWFRPARGQFQLYYRLNGGDAEYQPDFVAETDEGIFMIETKRVSDLKDPDVLAKKDVAVRWCGHASEYTAGYGGKPWRYVLIPHDSVAENMTLTGLAGQFTVVSHSGQASLHG